MTRDNAWDTSPLEDWDGPRRTIGYEEFTAEYRRLHNAWTYGDMPAEDLPLEMERLRGFIPRIDRTEFHHAAEALLSLWRLEASGERTDRRDRASGRQPGHPSSRSHDATDDTTVSGGDHSSADRPAEPPCPRCGEPSRPVLYGLPTEGAEQASRDRQIVLAGCMTPDEPDRWVCSSGHRWRDEDEERWEAALEAAITDSGYRDDD